MMGLKKVGDEYFFQSGKYEGKSLGVVLDDYDGRGWVIHYALYSGFRKLSDEDTAIVQRELERWYINNGRTALAECKVCGEAVPHNFNGCVACQLAELEVA